MLNINEFEWEMERLALYLLKISPKTRYCLMLDNVASHVKVQFDNLHILYLPPNTTSKTQPLDCSVFGTLKNKYNKWLIHETLKIGPERLKLESCVKSLASIFSQLDVPITNNGFKKTGLKLFQSEPTIETELTQDERIQYLCEQMDEFACSDSD